MDDPFDPWLPERQSTLAYIYQRWLPPIAVASLLVWAVASRLLHFYPPVGTYIAIVAVGGVVVTVWPPEKPWSKAAWLGVFVFLGFFEVQNLYRDRASHDKEQTESNQKQKEAFQGIANGITATINSGQQQFEATMERAGKVLSTTQSIAALAQQNLENTTGGDSFAYIVPQIDTGTVVRLALHNHGNADFGILNWPSSAA
jgi:hypothetical protein